MRFLLPAALSAAFMTSVTVAYTSDTGTATETQAPKETTTGFAHKTAKKAVHIAAKVGFKRTAPPGYWFTDTSDLTAPISSFGLFSDSNNQKIIFVIFNGMAPRALDRFAQVPPFSDVIAASPDELNKYESMKGSEILGNSKFDYYVKTYPIANQATKVMLVGLLPPQKADKSVLVLGQALHEGIYDYKSTLSLIDTMWKKRLRR
jgi:hypothetical protein